MCAGLQYAGSFHCLVEEWKDCHEPKTKSKDKWIFVNKKMMQISIRRSGVCDSKKVSVYEMWKE